MTDILTTADAFTRVREALRLQRVAGYQLGRITANSEASDEAIARAHNEGEKADQAVRDAWVALYDAYSTTGGEARKVAAQVAVEAIANDPSGYDEATKRDVLSNGADAGVAAFYLDMIR